jgi:alpha-tubulin suppressor-like RCC1 family protein
VDVVAANGHTCAVLRDGTVRCWGYNGNGQLGNNTYTSSASPVTVVQTDGTPLTGVTSIVGGLSYTCALVGDRVRCWGTGASGELGDNTTDYRNTPSKVLVKSGSSTVELTGVTALYGGWSHSCALVNGRARCWGANGYGQLGNNTKRYSTTAVFVVSPTGSEALTGIKSIAPGMTHSCAVVGTGALCWGKNDLGQLGNGTFNSRLLPAKVIAQSGTPLSDVRAITTTAFSTCAVVGSARGAACWGGDNEGALGNGSTASGPTPTPVVGLSDVESLSGNMSPYDAHVCARLANSRLSCWGNNRSGQLGNGTSSNQSSVPTEVWSNW